MTRSLSLILFSLLFAAVVNALTIDSARFTIQTADGEQLRSDKLSVSEKSKPTLTLRPRDVLKLAFTVLDTEGGNGVQPHQTFLRFYDEATGEEGIQPVRIASSGKGKFELNMARPPTSIPPTTTHPLQVTLLLGSFVHSPVKIELFKLALPPSQPAPVHPDEASFHPLPEIHHTFRPEQKNPPQFISFVFSAVVVAPWVVLLAMWSSIQPKVPQLLSSKILPFVVNLAAFEGLLLWYWVELRIGQVLAYGAVLGLLTATAGNRALSAIAAQRLHK